MQSLITGKLLIEIDFYPGTPVNLKDINKDYIEVPTIPSTTSKIGRALENLDLRRCNEIGIGPGRYCQAH